MGKVSEDELSIFKGVDVQQPNKIAYGCGVGFGVGYTIEDDVRSYPYPLEDFMKLYDDVREGRTNDPIQALSGKATHFIKCGWLDFDLKVQSMEFMSWTLVPTERGEIGIKLLRILLDNRNLKKNTREVKGVEGTRRRL